MSVYDSDEFTPNWFHERFSPEQLVHLRTHRVRGLIRLIYFLAIPLALLIPGYMFNALVFKDGMEPVWLLMSILSGIIAHLGILIMVGLFVKAVYGLRSWRQGLQYGLLCLFGRPKPIKYPFVIINQGAIRESDKDKFLANRDVGGPGTLIISSDSAVALEQYGQLSRIEGPGPVFVNRSERIREIIDLRPQTRTVTGKGYTRDGIEVEAEITARFQIKSGPPTLEKPYPIDMEALEKAAKSQAVRILGANPPGTMTWKDRVMGNVASTLREIIAAKTLDQLFEPADVTKDPRDEIGREMITQLRQKSEVFGAVMLDVILGPFKPANPQIEHQLRQAWLASHNAGSRVDEAHGQAEATLALQTAHAYAQLEMMLAIDRGFQKLVEQDENLPSHFIAMRFLDTLRQFAAAPNIGPFLPMETLKTLDFLNEKLLEPPSS